MFICSGLGGYKKFRTSSPGSNWPTVLILWSVGENQRSLQGATPPSLQVLSLAASVGSCGANLSLWWSVSASQALSFSATDGQCHRVLTRGWSFGIGHLAVSSLVLAQTLFGLGVSHLHYAQTLDAATVSQLFYSHPLRLVISWCFWQHYMIIAN